MNTFGRSMERRGEERGARNPDIIIIIYNYLFFRSLATVWNCGPKLRKREREREERRQKKKQMMCRRRRRTESRLSPRQTTTTTKPCCRAVLVFGDQKGRSIYSARNKGMQILLSNSQAGPGRRVKQEQEEISRNHVQAFIPGSVE